MSLPEYHQRVMTEEERVRMFRHATSRTCGADERWAKRAGRPMTDAELLAELRDELHTEGGGGGPDTPDYYYNASGVQVWVGWNINPCIDKPTWKGMATVAMARRVYGIRTPDEYAQPSLF